MGRRFVSFALSGCLATLISCGGGGGGGTTSTPAPTPTPTPTPSGTQVLLNTGFEQTSPLAWQGDTGVIQKAPGASQPTVVPNTGSLFAWLGGYGQVASDQITQDVALPNTAQSATLTFYVKILTAETGTTANDTCTVEVLDTTGASLGTVKTLSNLDAGDYKAITVDLMPYKGKTVRLSFKSQENATAATSFLLDDVTLNIAVPTPSDLAPIVSGFTPTSGLASETTVEITGGNFFNATKLTLGGVDTPFTLIDGTRMTATVPSNATFGTAPISVLNPQGTGTSTATFTVTYGQATLTSLNPTQGPVGTPVVITGTYLGYPGTTVTLNGQSVPLTSTSPTQILFSIPAGATSGNLVLTTPSGSLTRTFTVNSATSTLDVHVDKVELTQSAQTLNNAVPIVAGKNGLARVFVLANQTNTATPAVQVTLLNGGTPVPGYPKTLVAPSSSVPTALDESNLGTSWNLTIPGTDLTTPVGSGYSLEAVVDPGSSLAEADKTNNTLTVSLAGTTVPMFKTTIFPVVLSSGTGNISDTNKAEWVATLAKMYPIASVDVAVGAPFTGSVTTLQSDGTGWDTLLNDLTAKHLADAVSDRYYFGALNVSYSSGVAGLGWVPDAPSASFKFRTAIGWDKTGYRDGGNFPEVFTHETGHNMGRQHSPCGGAASPDPNYPYAGALIGTWGYDSTLNQLKDPTIYKDIMAYCTPNWVSDYVYKKILEFRNGTGGFLKVGAEDALSASNPTKPQTCLLVRGIVDPQGQVRLLPAFRTLALPSDRPASSSMTLECVDAQGQPVFTTPLELMDLGCWPKGREQQFVMALPLTASKLDAIVGLNVLQSGRIVASRRSVSPLARVVSAPPELMRVAPNVLQVTWDATLHPAALVRDVDTGFVVGILSGGRQMVPTRGRHFEVVLSDGVVSDTHLLDLAN